MVPNDFGMEFGNTVLRAKSLEKRVPRIVRHPAGSVVDFGRFPRGSERAKRERRERLSGTSVRINRRNGVADARFKRGGY